MSVKYFKNGQLTLIAGAGGINGDCDSKIFTGTTAEYEAQKDNIEDGTIINITDDIEEGIFIDIEEVLDRVAELEKDVEDIKNNSGGGEGSSSAVYLTQEQYDALPDDKLTNNIEYRITDASEDETARNIGYDNSTSGLNAINVQSAVDELSESLETLEWKLVDTFTHNANDHTENLSVDLSNYKEVRVIGIVKINDVAHYFNNSIFTSIIENETKFLLGGWWVTQSYGGSCWIIFTKTTIRFESSAFTIHGTNYPGTFYVYAR